MSPRLLLRRLSFFGCSHTFAWPRQCEDGKYYQVCTTCGGEFEYDWQTMQRRGPRTPVVPKMPSASVKSTHRSWRPRARRFEFSTPVRFCAAGTAEWFEGMITNVSESGVLLKSTVPAQLACEFEMVFTMPVEISSRPNAIAFARGTVVRASGKDGAFTAAVTINSVEYPEPKKTAPAAPGGSRT